MLDEICVFCGKFVRRTRDMNKFNFIHASLANIICAYQYKKAKQLRNYQKVALMIKLDMYLA